MTANTDARDGRTRLVTHILRMKEPAEFGIDPDVVEEGDVSQSKWMWRAMFNEPVPQVRDGTWDDVVRLMKLLRPGDWHLYGIIFRDPEKRHRYELLATGRGEG